MSRDKAERKDRCIICFFTLFTHIKIQKSPINVYCEFMLFSQKSDILFGYSDERTPKEEKYM
jgi:hypothetical protein